MTTGEFPSIDSPTFTLLDYILGQLAGAGIVPGGGGTTPGPSPGAGDLEDLLEQVKQHELSQVDLMELIVRELRKVNIHLSVLSNEEVDEADVETEQEP